MANKNDLAFKLIESNSLYDKLFAMLLVSIKDTKWANFFMKQMDFIKSISTITVEFGKRSCYSNEKICINFDDALIGISVIVHEYGHYIFDKMISKEEEEVITNLFKEEVAHLIEVEGLLAKLHKKYCPSINWMRICFDDRCCPSMLTDGIKLLGGKSCLGRNHNYDYPPDYLATELFAEALEAEVLNLNIPISIYKGECPRTYAYIKNKIYATLKP